MPTLLVIDASPRKKAVSRTLTERFVDRWNAAFPDGKVLYRDIGAVPSAHLDDELIDALRRNPETLTARQSAARVASDAMIAELQQADVIVIGAPLHNFTVPAALHTWIDHVARPGKTFGYDAVKGPYGLIGDKPVFVISTRGGQYGDGDPDRPHPADFQSPYLRQIFGFMGLNDVRIIAANGLDMGAEPRAEGIEVAQKKIDAAIGVLASDEAGAGHPRFGEVLADMAVGERGGRVQAGQATLH